MTFTTHQAAVGGSPLKMESPWLYLPAQRESEERKERRRAARNLIRHGQGDADRDLLLEIFGLTYADAAPMPTGPIAPPEQERPERKRCTKCGDDKPLDGFGLRCTASGQRYAQCRTCRADANRARRIAKGDSQ
jgi:hypothetical protein